MKNLEELVKEIINNSKKLKPEQIFFGQHKHPRIIKKKYQVPDYIQKYKRTANFVKVVYLVKGRAVVTLNKKTYSMLPGDLCLIRPEADHFESYYKEDVGYELVWMFYVGAEHLKILHTSYDSEQGWRLLESIAIKDKAEKYYLLENIFLLEKTKQNLNNIRAALFRWGRNLKNKLLSKKYQSLVLTETLSKDLDYKRKRIEKSVGYIYAHFRENISLKEAAEQSSLSRTYFSSLFTEIYRYTYYEYITILRMSYAMEKLNKTGLSVNEIAFEVGYKEPSLFRNMFKKYTGCSPVEYRKKIFRP